MTDRPIHRPGALITCCTLAALGAATAVPAALADAYAVCAVGLFALGGGALAAYRTSEAPSTGPTTPSSSGSGRPPPSAPRPSPTSSACARPLYGSVFAG
ncbi:hypothetical protein P3T35_006153 [Kitasatospora sp. GP30]|uniref:hypothetical protein n=1 Tax=Kitasatospora sp. GP30 TaxID=3035084 RepID=UPI000CB51068|nr:hypothetical protein [Kitasatospora sp. GP30]MDH6144116.1 hypothetical protein [Kitasatospora sp. GP30]